VIARLLQQVFGGIIEVALRLMGAILGGFLGAPGAALAPITIRTASPRQIEGVHEVVLGLAPVADEARRYWAAERNGLVIGALTAVAGDGWELRELAVLPQYDAREVGTALLRHAETELGGPLWTASPDLPEIYRGWQDDGDGVLRWSS